MGTKYHSVNNRSSIFFLPAFTYKYIQTCTYITDIYFWFIDYAKAFGCVGHNKLWKILKEMGIPDYLTCLLKNLYAGQEETVRIGHGTIDWSKTYKSGNEYINTVHCHSVYLTYMQKTWCEMMGWMKHKLESRLSGEISITSDMKMTSPLWQKAKKK